MIPAPKKDLPPSAQLNPPADFFVVNLRESDKGFFNLLHYKNRGKK